MSAVDRPRAAHRSGTRRRAFGSGAWSGALVAAPLVGAWYAAWKVWELPFAPFDLFDYLARVLPGPLVTLIIDGLVSSFAALHVHAVSGAKLVEEAAALALTFGIVAATAGVVFLLGQLSGEPSMLLGAILGAMLGGLIVVLEDALNRLTTPGALVSGVWLFGTSLAWGIGLGWFSDANARRPNATAAERRQFLLKVGNAAAATTAATVMLGLLAEEGSEDTTDDRWSATHRLPNNEAEPQPVPGTRRELTPLEDHYRVDVDTRPPALNRQRWRLRIGGLVDPPINLSMTELRRIEPLDQFVTLSCISNIPGGELISTTRWTGASLQRVLARLPVPRGTTHLRVTAADGFTEVVPLADIQADPRIMLTYAWDGIPLSLEHGRPLRLYVPDRYGMKQPKWIVALDCLDHWEEGYWVARGWDREGRVRSTSAIDVVATGSGVAASGEALLTLGGVAYAGARGVSRVEIQIDGGEWRQAALRPPLSPTSWVLWRAAVPRPATAGPHRATVRCYEGDGRLQSGALHSKPFTV